MASLKITFLKPPVTSIKVQFSKQPVVAAIEVTFSKEKVRLLESHVPIYIFQFVRHFLNVLHSDRTIDNVIDNKPQLKPM